jgi:hypothetical protein
VGILFIRHPRISADSPITINDETVTYEFLSTENGVHHRHVRRTRIRRDRKHQYTGFGCRCRVIRHGGGLNPMNVYAGVSIRQGHGHAGVRRHEQQRALARAPTRAGGSVRDSLDVWFRFHISCLINDVIFCDMIEIYMYMHQNPATTTEARERRGTYALPRNPSATIARPRSGSTRTS